jgi:hypothetical protein
VDGNASDGKLSARERDLMKLLFNLRAGMQPHWSWLHRFKTPVLALRRRLVMQNYARQTISINSLKGPIAKGKRLERNRFSQGRAKARETACSRVIARPDVIASEKAVPSRVASIFTI